MQSSIFYSSEPNIIRVQFRVNKGKYSWYRLTHLGNIFISYHFFFVVTGIWLPSCRGIVNLIWSSHLPLIICKCLFFVVAFRFRWIMFLPLCPSFVKGTYICHIIKTDLGESDFSFHSLSLNQWCFVNNGSFVCDRPEPFNNVWLQN